MSKRNSENKSAKGEFEEFKSAWLLQVAADRGAKAAAPAAMVIACDHLNRGTGKAWPGINTLKKKTGAASANTVRSALKLLEERGHALIEWSDGGKNKTHVVTPLVNGKPFRKLKGMEDRNPSTSDPETLQVSDAKPFKKLNPNHLKEPLDIQGAAQAAPPEDGDNISDGGEPAFADASRSPIGGEIDYSLGDVGEAPAWIDEAPPPTSLDDYLAGDDPFVADDHSSAGQKRTTNADVSYDDADDASRADDLLRACIERVGDLAGDDQRRVQAMEKRRSAGRTLEESEINTLAMMHRRLRDRADDFTWQDLRTNEAMKEGKRP